MIPSAPSPAKMVRLSKSRPGKVAYLCPTKRSRRRKPPTWRTIQVPCSNDELRATWTLVVQGGKLIRQQWMAEDQELELAFSDGFIWRPERRTICDAL